MKRSWPYLILLVGVMVLIGYIAQQNSNQRINWEPNYRVDSKVPYGCYLASYYLETTLHGGLKYSDQTVYGELQDSTITGHNYVFINTNFSPSALDVFALCDFAANGNTVFISATEFGMLADTLHFQVRDPLTYHMQFDTTLNAAIAYSQDTVRMNLVNPALTLQDPPAYDREYISYAFLRLKPQDVTILGIDRSGYPNYIRKKFGKGEFLLHCMPEAFVNYYAGKPENAKYVFGAFTYLPDQATIVDRHYKIGRVMNDDSRRFILSQPALKLAYYIVIIAGGIALLFGGKRRQRPVPVVQGFRNSTLDFVEQVGALYYRNSDHTNIIHKKINYFLESVRSRFFVSTVEIDQKLAERVTSLSGVPFLQVQKLFGMIKMLRAMEAHSDENLKALDSAIREFNKRSKR